MMLVMVANFQAILNGPQEKNVYWILLTCVAGSVLNTKFQFTFVSQINCLKVCGHKNFIHQHVKPFYNADEGHIETEDAPEDGLVSSSCMLCCLK